MWPQDLRQEMVTSGCYFHCNGHSSTKDTGQAAANMSQETHSGPGSAKMTNRR